MFRGCYFEFAGQSSERYNLMLFYKDNNNDDFSSGGEFDLKTDSIPYSHEQILYGKDYSDKPLEFEVEIITPERNIPNSQMPEIKNWLYGQDGWRDLTITDDTQEYHLKCVLIPLQDITDSNGYRGVRCTIHNASPFWYGEEKEIVLDHATLSENVWWDTGHTWDRWCTFKIDIPNNDYVDIDIYPTIEISPRRNTNKPGADGAWTVGTYFALTNTPATTIAEGHNHANHVYKIEESSRISCSLQYMESNGLVTYSYTESSNVYTISVNGNVICTVTTDNDKYKILVNNVEVGSVNVSDYSSLDESYSKPVVAALNYMGYRVESTTEAIYAIDNLEINTKYAIVKSEIYPELFIPLTLNLDLPKPMFKLHYGTNICRIYFGHFYDSLTIRYTPLLRMGAF